MRYLLTVVLAFLLSTIVAASEPKSSKEFADLVDAIKSVQRDGQGLRDASLAATELSEGSTDDLLLILDEFDGANPLATNMLRSAVETLVDRAINEGKTLPTERLAQFVEDTSENDSQARHLAFELLERTAPDTAEKMLPNLLTDPNPDLRREAVAYWIGEAKRLEAGGDTENGQKAYKRALQGATDDDQVKTIAAALKRQGVEIDIRRHFGFLTDWQVIGPFDNRDMKGFDVAYPPESELDFDARYEGQRGEVRWQPISTDDEYGVVDIAKSLENFKGSVMYLATEVEAHKQQDVEVRLGTANSWKLWLNGEHLFGREEYHRGMILDQYRVPATLKKGKNVILFKLLQNEQDQDWAQSYKFQLRLTDEAGQAVRFENERE